MMIGKSRFRRTTSMTGITAVDLENDVVESAPPTPPPPLPPLFADELKQHHQFTAMVSPRFYSAGGGDFLKRCGLCNRRLVTGRDIYMYRGDTPFCSQECREQQMKEDERKEKLKVKIGNKGDNHHNLSELSTASSETGGPSETVAAA